MILKSCLFIATALCAEASMASLSLHKVPPEITLEAKKGGKVQGGSWSSKELRGKVHVVFYVAPSAERENQKARDELKKENFPSEKFASVAIINMKASNIPNFLISSRLSSSQKENPRTLYVEDRQRELVEKWHLADNTSDVMVFNKAGQVIFSVDGKLNDDQIKEMMTLIKTELAEKPTQQLESSKTETNSKTHRNEDQTP